MTQKISRIRLLTQLGLSAALGVCAVLPLYAEVQPLPATLRPYTEPMPLPPTYAEYHRLAPTQPAPAAADHPAADTPELHQLRATLQPIQAQLTTNKAIPPSTADQMATIEKNLRELNAWQTKAATDPATLDQTTTEKMHTHIHDLRTQVDTLHASLLQSADRLGAAAVKPSTAAPSPTATTPADTAALAASLQALSQELATREDAVQKMLDIIQQQGESATILGASLLAIQHYPAAAGGLGLFIFALIYLFRGRIAELSGLGLSLKLRHPLRRSSDTRAHHKSQKEHDKRKEDDRIK